MNLHRMSQEDFNRTQPIVMPHEDMTLREMAADIWPAIAITAGAVACVLWSDIWWPWIRRLVAVSAVILVGCGGGEPEPEEPCKTTTSAPSGKTSVAEVCR